MSILINGMGLPNPGQIILVEIDENGDVFAAYDGGRTKLAEYKAVTVPPHGELIDLSTVNLSDGPYEYDDWVEWALEQYQDAPVFLPAEPPKEEA